MVWQGQQEVTGYAGGKHGGYVRLGDTVVPPRAVLTYKGIKGSPDVTMRFEVRGERPECVEVHVQAKPDGRGIRSADMAVFNLDNLTANVFTELALIGADEEGVPLRRAAAAEVDTWAADRDVREARARHHGTVSRAELEDVARVYREHLDASPTRAVALLGGYSERTAARRIKQAEEAGLLPPTTPGRKRRP